MSFILFNQAKEQIPNTKMSYTLEDLINSLTQGRSYNQRQPQAFYPQQFYYPYQDDEEEEDAYYPRYPDYYSPFGFYGQDPRRIQAAQAQAQAQARAQAQAQATRKLQERQRARSQEGEDSTGDVLDILSQLTGIPKSQFNVQTPKQSKPGQETTLETAKETQKGNKEIESAEKLEEKVESQSIKESEVAPQIKGGVPDANPLSKLCHSTASFKEPEPKVEISQRNFKNPTVPFSPQSNVYDTEKDYIIVLAIPGASLKDLDTDFHPSTNEIVVKGSIPEPLSEQGIKFNEIRTGNIERRFKFPALPKINDEQIKAKYVNGLLTITIPKSTEKLVKPKRKVTIEEVPDDELIYEEHGGLVQ